MKPATPFASTAPRPCCTSWRTKRTPTGDEIRARCTARGWSFIEAPVEMKFEGELALGALRRGLLSRGR